MTTKFDLQGYYAHEKKIGPQGGGWATPKNNTTMELNELEKIALVEHLYEWLDTNDSDEILRDILIKINNK